MYIKDIEYKNIKNILQSVVVTMIYIFNFSLYYFWITLHTYTNVYVIYRLHLLLPLLQRTY